MAEQNVHNAFEVFIKNDKEVFRSIAATEERVDHPLPFLQWIVGRKSVGPLGCGFLQRGAQELEDKKKENGLRKTDLLLCLRELRSAWIGMALASAAAGFVWVEWVWAVLEWRAWIPTPSFLTQQLP